MSDQGLEHSKPEGVAERTPSSPLTEIPPRSPSKTSPRRSRSLSKSLSQSQASEEASEDESEEGEIEAPPLPDEPLPPSEGDEPPLPDEPIPEAVQDDGWDAQCDPTSGQWYFVNRFTGVSQWENPRVPSGNPQTTYTGPPGTEPSSGPPGTQSETSAQAQPPSEPYLGYNPKIHGDFDPNADYARFHQPEPSVPEPSVDINDAATKIDAYGQTGTFNRRTGAYQGGDKNAEYHNDDHKSKRQMNAFFDVDRAANAHDGRSLKAERANKKMSKEQVKAFNEQRRARKEQKRREFLLS